MTERVVIALTAFFLYGAADPSPLPEIGRVRASPAACTVAREVGGPATDAVLTAVNSYVAARAPMREFASDISGGSPRSEIDREHIRLRANAVRYALLTIAKSLGDPRVSSEAANRDPQIARIRASLQDLERAVALENRLFDQVLVAGLVDDKGGPAALKTLPPRPPRVFVGGLRWVASGSPSVDADRMDQLNTDVFRVAEASILHGAPEVRTLASVCHQ